MLDKSFIREEVMSGDMTHLCITHIQGFLSKSERWHGAYSCRGEFSFALEIKLGKNIELVVALCVFGRNSILNGLSPMIETKTARIGNKEVRL